MPNYHKLCTAQDSAVVFIDHQPQMMFGVASIDRSCLINNVRLLAAAAKEFNVPTVMAALETESFSGYVCPQLLDALPGQAIIEHSSMNLWDDAGFRRAVEATGRKNILVTGAWTESAVAWTAISMMGEGYNVYVVEDCCGAMSTTAQKAALSRMVQAGAVRLTAIAALLEWQRDWRNKDHYHALMEIVKKYGGAYGSAMEYAHTMVHKAPQSAKRPHIVRQKAEAVWESRQTAVVL